MLTDIPNGLRIIERLDDDEELDYAGALARMSHIGAEITPCQPPQSWYDEEWEHDDE